ncbi:uncharacterized protein A4U43_C05F22900 [Asparagus officinalis]|uniref:Trichome birefringence-like C-terminal domain-containing protein n=1 Tax=Asparagus officinalis TaxID=4686 RepID=A0A5P1EY24_ASPOF|nr:uncharacterized protein A4U43_C05F22900 [Asparagus officinalis]
MYYSAFNFTIIIYWSPFLIRAKQTRGPDRMILWNFHLDEVDKTWASHIDDFNYVIISGGNWFNRPSIFYQKRRIVGCLYCPSKKVTHRTMHYSHRKAFHTAFQAINKSSKFKGTVILRSVSPSHFENGVWDKGGDCVRTQPFRRNETALSVDDIQIYKDQLKEFQIAKEEGKKKGIDFKLLDTTNAMLLRPDGHPSRYGHWPNAKVTLYNDCVHWCLPGPVDMWNDILLQMLNV